jgi:NTE family protein
MKEPKVALVVGGGGIKPYSVIPLLAFLDQHNISLNLIVGCSGGSIMSTLWASGFSTEEIINEIVPRLNAKLFRLNIGAIAAIAGLPFSKMDRANAFIKPDPIRSFFREIYGNKKLEDLNLKTVLQVTDFQTGVGFGLETGDIADSVYASSAIYPLLPAIKIGNRWLFDGGFSAPVPLLEAVKHKPDIIIVVDFMEKLNPDPHGYFETSMHIGKINAKTIAASQTCLTINLLEGEIIYVRMIFDEYISFWEIEKIPAILAAGENALAKVKDEILLAYNHFRENETRNNDK